MGSSDQLTKSRWISVTASGEASVAPDMAVVTLTVTEMGADLAATRNEVNSRSSTVLAAVRALGLAEKDIDAPDIAIHPQYDYRRGQRLLGYRVARSMTVRVRDLSLLGDVLDGVSRAGANEVHGAQMVSSDPTAAEQAALVAAVGAARAKAEALAQAAGVTLGAVARIEEEGGWDGPPQPMFRMAAAAESADVPTEVVAGDLTVKRQIRVWFLIS